MVTSRVEKARDMGKTHLPAYFPITSVAQSSITDRLNQDFDKIFSKESNQYDFISELNESRLYRRSSKPKTLILKTLQN